MTWGLWNHNYLIFLVNKCMCWLSLLWLFVQMWRMQNWTNAIFVKLNYKSNLNHSNAFFWNFRYSHYKCNQCNYATKEPNRIPANISQTFSIFNSKFQLRILSNNNTNQNKNKPKELAKEMKVNIKKKLLNSLKKLISFP